VGSLITFLTRELPILALDLFGPCGTARFGDRWESFCDNGAGLTIFNVFYVVAVAWKFIRRHESARNVLVSRSVYSGYRNRETTPTNLIDRRCPLIVFRAANPQPVLVSFT
jgi:hypothetical protein